MTAQLPGADPQTMASSLATPLEQQFSKIPGVHVHLDLIERSNNYRICQWDVLDVIETAALAAKKAATAAASIPAVVPLPRPRPVVNTVLSGRPRHRIARLGEGARGPLFSLFAPSGRWDAGKIPFPGNGDWGYRR